MSNNFYEEHPLQINSGTFWRCKHGLTGLGEGGELVGCYECAVEKIAAEREARVRAEDERDVIKFAINTRETKLAARCHQLEIAISDLKRGDCWCEAGTGNPMMAGRHTDACANAIAALAHDKVES